MSDAQFEYRMKQVLSQMYHDYKEDANQDGEDGISFPDYVWKNLTEFGRLTFEEIDSWCGMDELCQEVETK